MGKNWQSMRLRSRRWWRSFSLFCLCTLLVLGCSRSASDHSQSTQNHDRIILGTTTNITTIDPADAYSTFAGTLLYNLGDRLYTYKSGTGDLQPQLATALPTISSDGLTYKIPLRQGVVFHDGTPFDAKAMVFSLERFIKNGGSPSFLLADAVETIQTTGAFELTIKLKQPFAAFPSLLAFSGTCAVSPKVYEIKENSFKPEEFVGTGPYRLVKVGTDQIRLDVFDRYWGEKPANQGVDIQVFSSGANLFNAFRTGSVDVAYKSLELEQVKALQDSANSGGWKILQKSGSGIDYVSVNLQSSPLNQPEVRQAIAAIIDRPLLSQRIFQGQVDPLYSLIPSSMTTQVPAFQTTYGNANAEQAKALLEKVGYSLSNPLKVELWYRSNVSTDQLAAITLKAIARKQLGGLLQLQLNSVESTTAYRNLDKGAYPMFMLDWSPDFFDPDNYLYPFVDCIKGSVEQGCTEGQSFAQGSFYYSDRANQLLKQSRQELNPQKRQQILAELQQLVATEVPFIPLWQTKDFLFVQQWINGASLEVTQKVPFWSLKKG